MQERNTCKCTFIVNDAYLEEWGYEIDIKETTPESSTQLDQIERQLQECIKKVELLQIHIIEISNRIRFLKIPNRRNWRNYKSDFDTQVILELVVVDILVPDVVIVTLFSLICTILPV